MLYGNNVSAIDLESSMPYHVDIPRLRQGKVGGFFWLALFSCWSYISPLHLSKPRSTYVSCANPEDEGRDFTNATWRVRFVCCSLWQRATDSNIVRYRDTLEQIDVAKLLIAKYPDVSGGRSYLVGPALKSLRHFNWHLAPRTSGLP